jgi:hypothetical protein
LETSNANWDAAFIMRSDSHLAKRPKGQIAVVIGVAAVGLISSMALAADVGVFYWTWAYLQKAADAAVLAGGTYLPEMQDRAMQKAREYVGRNGVDESEITDLAVSDDGRQISISLQRTVPYFFARVVGLAQDDVSVRAVAEVKPSGTARGLIPVGVDHRTDLTPYQTITLKGGPFIAPGNWKPLALGAPGADIYRSNLEYGYQGEVKIADFVDTETGVMAGPTEQGLQARIDNGLANYPEGTADVHELNDARVVQLPIIDFTEIEGKSSVPVLGFAVFWLTSVNGNGDITGQFIRQVTSGDRPADNAPLFGALSVVLVE